MATKIYAFGDAIRIELDGKAPLDQPKNTLRVTITEQTLPKKDIINISLASAESTSIGQYIDSKPFDEIQDSSGTSYSTVSSQVVQDALNAFFFLASGSAVNIANVFDIVKTETTYEFGIDTLSNITTSSVTLDRKGVFFIQDVHSIEFTWKNLPGQGSSGWVGLGGTAASFTAITLMYAFATVTSVIEMIPANFIGLVAYAPLLDFSAYTRFKIWRDDSVSPCQYTLFGWNGTIFVPIYAPFDKNTVPFNGKTGIQTNSQLGFSKDSGVSVGFMELDVYLNGGNSTALNQGVKMFDVLIGTPLPT